ncbi:hypothetical protein KJ570_01080 [Patescibacteria group bacterium]|nr:hypothetical protein [Patescibacteria group bacterium]MBU2036540.1 hypothetical protein [Patescibacteria group bacterium]
MVYAIPISAPISSYGEVNLIEKTSVTPAFVGSNDGEALLFMETFSFPNLKKMKASLKKEKYSTEEINEIILGLKTLPEYKRG